MHKVAVYGSLRQGYWNNWVLGDSPLLTMGVTDPIYTMTADSFPFVNEGGDTAITVEVYEVNDRVKANCDSLEGHPTFYKRTPVTLQCGLEVEMYISQGSTGRFDVPTGDYKDFR